MGSAPTPRTLSFVRRFPERTREEVGHTEHRRIDAQIVAIQPLRLDSDDAEDVAPLTLGRLSTPPIPTQLLQQNVLRRMYVESTARGDLDCPPPTQLLLVERRAARNEYVDFQLCSLMDEVDAGTLPNGAAQSVFVNEEVR